MEVQLYNLPPKYKERALFYSEWGNKEDVNLGSAFMWEYTYEKTKFWANLYDVIEGTEAIQEANNLLAPVPELNISGFKKQYIAHCTVDECALSHAQRFEWSGSVYVHTGGTKYDSFFVTPVEGEFHFSDVYDRYWSSAVSNLNLHTII